MLLNAYSLLQHQTTIHYHDDHYYNTTTTNTLKKYTKSTHYYYYNNETSSESLSSNNNTNNNNNNKLLFEQSLDIYEPVIDETNDDYYHIENEDHDDNNNNNYNNNNNDDDNDTSKPIILFVVGSGWMGYYSWIYTGTSWWNSSGPKNICTSLNTTCICIRHRGSYFHFLKCIHLPITILLFIFTIVLIITTYLGIITEKVGTKLYKFITISSIITSSILFIILLLKCTQPDPYTTFDDMLHDVAQAISWIQQRYSNNKNKNNDNNNNIKRKKMIFGGYSSGGHVASILLHQQWDNIRNKYHYEEVLPASPEDLFDGILLVSGVLAVRPCTINIIQQQQPEQNDNNNNNNILEQQQENIQNDSTSSSNNSTNTTTITVGGNGIPTFLTDLVLRIVWGNNADDISSPILSTTPCCNIPHLIIGCEYELPFGFNWLNIYFCSKQFVQMLSKCHNIPTIYRTISNSDHWRILNSNGLSKVLQDEIPNLLISIHDTTVATTTTTNVARKSLSNNKKDKKSSYRNPSIIMPSLIKTSSDEMEDDDDEDHSNSCSSSSSAMILMKTLSKNDNK